MKLTAEQIKAIMPESGRRAVLFAEPLNAAMEEFQINTTLRIAAFIAQIGHESGRLVYTRELWGPTKAQVGYEGRKDLGNNQPGDGKRYMGRGLIQITGRRNYELCGFALDADLIGSPQLLEKPDLACRSAAWFWHNNGLNELADAKEFDKITRRINGGQNGKEDRWEIYKKALEVLT